MYHLQRLYQLLVDNNCHLSVKAMQWSSACYVVLIVLDAVRSIRSAINVAAVALILS